MGASVQPIPVTPDDAEFQAWKAQQGAQSPQPAPVAAQGPITPLTHDDAEFQAWKASRGLYDRTKDLISAAIPSSLSELGADAKALVTAPLKSAYDAVFAPGVGEARPDARLSKGGNSSGRAIDTTPYDADHGAVTGRERTVAGAQTVANLAFPLVAKGAGSLMPDALGPTVAKAAGLMAGGAGAGAAYNPDDPLAGAAAGALLAPAAHAAFQGASAGLGAMKGVGNVLIDAAGRSTTAQPVRVMGQQIGTVQSLADRAAELNRRALVNSPSNDGLPADASKPVTPMDVAGTSGVRIARGLKTANPAAESVFRRELTGRADDAVPRVIQHGLETAGLSSRENGTQVVADMIAQRSAEANASWPKVFEQNPQAINDPRIAQIMGTDSGPKAWKEVPGLMKDRFLPEPPPAAAGIPAGYSPDQWEQIRQAAIARGIPMPGADTGPQMNLQQLHYWAKALDDMGEPGYNKGPGSTGNGYNKGTGIQDLASQVRQIAKDANPDYAANSQRYADDSDLVRGAELGQNLWKMHPDVAQQAMSKLPASAQDVFRRTGFDAWAERVENGPDDVERGVSKPRDQQRMRLLFPDQTSFDTFKQGLAQEAQMHANEQGALGGSVTADKLADMANMAGITLPDVARAAASGRWHYLAGRALANTTRKLMAPGADAVSVERARQLVAGANGDVGARNIALGQLGLTAPSGPQYVPPPGDPSFQSALARAFAGQYAQRLPMLTLPGPYDRSSGGQQP